MVSLTKIRDLDLAAATRPERPLHLSAASGLVCVGDRFYVVADDELHLAAFRTGSAEPGQLIRLFEGALPASKSKRKKHKPDLEALAWLPAQVGHPHGTLLALGSGSASLANRRVGALLSLDAQGDVMGAPRTLDFSALFVPLEERFAGLNIEGATANGNEFWLLQRGNKGDRQNAVIRYSLVAFLDALNSDEVGEIEPIGFSDFDLGEIDGIPLGFTDGAALPDGRLVFSAVAEDTENPYLDGRCAGAAIGIVERDEVRDLRPLDRPYKIEGVSARANDNGIDLLLVTDDDDPSIPAGLFWARIES
jgi:hypothetical protein